MAPPASILVALLAACAGSPAAPTTVAAIPVASGPSPTSPSPPAIDAGFDGGAFDDASASDEADVPAAVATTTDAAPQAMWHGPMTRGASLVGVQVERGAPDLGAVVASLRASLIAPAKSCFDDAVHADPSLVDRAVRVILELDVASDGAVTVKGVSGASPFLTQCVRAAAQAARLPAGGGDQLFVTLGFLEPVDGHPCSSDSDCVCPSEGRPETRSTCACEAGRCVVHPPPPCPKC